MTTAWALLTIGQEVELEYKAEMCTNNNISVLLAVHAWVGKSNVFSSDGYCNLYTFSGDRGESSSRNRTAVSTVLAA